MIQGWWLFGMSPYNSAPGGFLYRSAEPMDIAIIHEQHFNGERHLLRCTDDPLAVIKWCKDGELPL